jgi:hypothetical protein
MIRRHNFAWPKVALINEVTRQINALFTNYSLATASSRHIEISRVHCVHAREHIHTYTHIYIYTHTYSRV